MANIYYNGFYSSRKRLHSHVLELRNQNGVKVYTDCIHSLFLLAHRGKIRDFSPTGSNTLISICASGDPRIDPWGGNRAAPFFLSLAGGYFSPEYPNWPVKAGLRQ